MKKFIFILMSGMLSFPAYADRFEVTAAFECYQQPNPDPRYWMCLKTQIYEAHCCQDAHNKLKEESTNCCHMAVQTEYLNPVKCTPLKGSP